MFYLKVLAAKLAHLVTANEKFDDENEKNQSESKTENPKGRLSLDYQNLPQYVLNMAKVIKFGRALLGSDEKR